MDLSDDLVTMTDIARLAEVKLPTVSNWRRRHETFPRSERRNGQELFVAAEVEHWLDGRKIARNDLKKNEFPGTTYGARFRRNNLQIMARPDARLKEVLWKELSRFRGTEDIAVYADLILGLLYLSVRERDRWVDIAAAGGSEIADLVEMAIFEHEPALLQLHRALSPVRVESRGLERLSEIIRVLDQVQWRTDSEDGRSRWGGEVFEYLLDRFAIAEGKRGVVGTPPSVVRVLVELIAPKPGDSVLDPCSDAGGFLVGAAKYVEAHGGCVSDVSFFGQTMMERSWSLARMRLDLHGVPADFAVRPGIALDDLHAGRKFDAILANPPFNISHWNSGQPADRYWRYGAPPKSNANFAWLQHIWSSLAEGGRAAVVMANGALSSEQGGEGGIRAAMVEDGVVEALIALPPQLFATTAIPVTVWLLRRPSDTRADEVLFVDARKLGSMLSRTQRGLLPYDICLISDTVLEWRDRRNQEGYQDLPGFSASVAIQMIREHDYQLAPGRYVGTEITTGISAGSVAKLRRELDRLHLRAVEVDAIADRQLDRIAAWIP
jgi:type I restriction enzyme M protein